MIAIEIDPGEETTRTLWNQLGELADALPDGWVLVGGLMVQLHALEHEVAVVRVTKDIDLLGQARPPGKLRALHQSLREEEFEFSGLDLDGYGYRYERDGIIVDLLAPDGMRKPPELCLPIPRVSGPRRRAIPSTSESSRGSAVRNENPSCVRPNSGACSWRRPVAWRPSVR